MRLTIRKLAASAVLLVAACGDGSTDPITSNVASLNVVAGDGQWGEANASLANDLVVHAVDDEGASVAGARIDWSASAGSLSVMTAVTGADGRAATRWRLGGGGVRQTVTARVRGGPSAQFSATLATSMSASGRVFTLDGAAPGPLTIAVNSLAGTASAALAGDGSFQIQATVAGDSIEFLIDAAPGTARTYHPALVRVALGTTPDLRIVLVPREWMIAGGIYSGRRTTISMDNAFQPPCSDLGDANCDGFFPRVWTTGMKLWPASALPIRVAFDRVRTTQPITASDSIDFWAIMQRMNTDFGAQLFRPARYDELTVASDGRPDRAVLVRVDTTLSGFGAWTNWSWDAAGDLNSAVVRPARASFMRNVSLMTHELLHTQGFKHSCAWPTVMGGYGCSSFAGLSQNDVAHAQLALRMRELQKATGAPHGLIAALQGERKVLLGKTLFAVPDAPRLRSLRADSIREHGGDSAH